MSNRSNLTRRFLAAFLAVSLLFAGCAAKQEEPQQKQYKATYLTVFDTVTIMLGYAEDEDAFYRVTDGLIDELTEYHQLFDIYKTYDGINNLKTVNDNAGIAPVKVDQRIIALLTECRELYNATGGAVNVAMGSVLRLWHNEREWGIDDPENARLPDADKLREASEHCSFDTVIIDEQASTVYISDPKQRLDVGAIAKGWSAEQVSRHAPQGMLISVGGNICCTGAKPENGEPWVVGIQDPDDSGKYLHTLYVDGGCVVTSGDYQRYYVVDGKRYHHIIDPKTLYPSEKWRSVTICCADSGIGDALSTALFVLSKEEGEALLAQYDAQAMWVDMEGNVTYSEGMEAMIKT